MSPTDPVPPGSPRIGVPADVQEIVGRLGEDAALAEVGAAAPAEARTG